LAAVFVEAVLLAGAAFWPALAAVVELVDFLEVVLASAVCVAVFAFPRRPLMASRTTTLPSSPSTWSTFADNPLQVVLGRLRP
jgi:hypothetical protein